MEGYDRLSKRQKECLRLVAQGYSSKQIGRILNISDRTVDNHLFSATELVGIPRRGDAAREMIAEESKQNLPKQPPRVAEVPVVSSLGDTEANTGSRGFSRFVPPLGGHRNTLDAEQRIYAIVRVAVLSLASVIILTLAAAVLLWLIR